MTDDQIPQADAALAAELLRAIDGARATDDAIELLVLVGDDWFELPDGAVAALVAVLRLLAAQRAVVVFNEAIEARDRQRCADCGEPVELENADDPESWMHAPDANDDGSHTAWVDDVQPA